MKKYVIERDGQLDFFNNFRIDYINQPVLIDNTDGVWNGCLLEFKLQIDNPNKVLFQAIKYLSRMRIKGESVPKTIVLISLNTYECYVYDSNDYYEDIHKVYIGASSINNDNFIGSSPLHKLDISSEIDVNKLIHILNDQKEVSEMYIPIEIDENCIVGWAERYYRELPKATKGDFLGSNEGLIPIIGEIREPRQFKDLIKPYTKQTNEKFKYLMDVLNDRLKKKDLGAFYTPIPYCEKAAELVQMAIDKIPEGNDYIILDRCAGSGNLESVFTDEILSHCVLSTYEYYEYKVLLERLGDKVRAIIPPTENMVNYSLGCILNANALDKEYIENELIKQYIANPKCTIILFENPPYRDITAQDKVDVKKKTYVYEEFIKNGTDQASHREIANLFIWSAFKYYLRQPTDSYVVFSPVKYFKSLNLVDRKFIKGFAFNRKYFHSSSSVISCLLWQNIKEEKREDYMLEAYDIENDAIKYEKDLIIRKVYKTFNEYNDKRKFSDDVEGTVYCDNGTGKQSIKPTGLKMPIYNKNIVGYLRATSFNLNANSRCLTRTITYDALTQSYGFYLRRDNYITKLPLFSAKLFPQDKWYDKDVYFTTSDGGNKYIEDKEFLKKNLIYTALSFENHCASFIDTYGKLVKNELCLDKDSIARKDLEQYDLDADDKMILGLYDKILDEIKLTDNYNSEFTYGTNQINKDLNEFTIDENDNRIYKYPELNGNLKTLQNRLKEYYNKYLLSKLFKYELLK